MQAGDPSGTGRGGESLYRSVSCSSSSAAQLSPRLVAKPLLPSPLCCSASCTETRPASLTRRRFHASSTGGGVPSPWLTMAAGSTARRSAQLLRVLWNLKNLELLVTCLFPPAVPHHRRGEPGLPGRGPHSVRGGDGGRRCLGQNQRDVCGQRLCPLPGHQVEGTCTHCLSVSVLEASLCPERRPLIDRNCITFSSEKFVTFGQSEKTSVWSASRKQRANSSAF